MPRRPGPHKHYLRDYRHEYEGTFHDTEERVPGCLLCEQERIIRTIADLPPVVFASDDKEREMLPKGVVLRILRGEDAEDSQDEIRNLKERDFWASQTIREQEDQLKAAQWENEVMREALTKIADSENPRQAKSAAKAAAALVKIKRANYKPAEDELEPA